MYPEADIPVVQLSIDGTQPAAYHYELGQKLAALREQGVMIVASGNVVHNLRLGKWQGESSPYPWAESFNQFVRDNLSYQGMTTRWLTLCNMKARHYPIHRQSIICHCCMC